MKKFNFRGVLDGLRSTVSNTPKLDIDIEETLRNEDFKVTKVYKFVNFIIIMTIFSLNQ